MGFGTGFERLAVIALLASAIVVWQGLVRRSERERLRAVAFLTGLGVVGATVLSPLETLGARGLLIAHVAQHILLSDFAPPLLLLGLPSRARRRLGTRLLGLGAGRAGLLVSPLGALAAWAVVTYVWYVPPVHRAAVPAGVVHAADHISFFAAGFLVWLTPFDPRPTLAVRGGLRRGRLPWWGRHIYVMVSRLAMLVPAVAVWSASPGTYHPAGVAVPFGYSYAADQSRAAQVIVGYEMLLFALTVVLAFIFLAVADGRASRAAVEPVLPSDR